MRAVVIRAFVRRNLVSSGSGRTAFTPSDREEWIALDAGEGRRGLVLVVGVLPACAPEQPATRLNGVDVVMQEHHEKSELPKEFLGLYRLSIDLPLLGEGKNLN
jgi:hypothetical protein